MSNARTRAAVLLGALGVTVVGALAVPAIASADGGGSDAPPGWSDVISGPGASFTFSLTPQQPNWLPPSPCDIGQQACVLPYWLP